MTAGVMLLLAATIYGIGKAFFWPTSIGVVSEQSPRGGAITINVVAGVGMLAAGIVGSPLIGGVQDNHMVKALQAYDAQHATQLEATLTTQRTGVFGTYTAVDPVKRGAIEPETKAVVDAIDNESKRDALRSIAILPLIMLLAYLGMMLYFRSKGGYRPVVLDLKH
jgi:hypothetical protein